MVEIMNTIGEVRKGAYFDSVTLMNVGKILAAREGVEDAAIVMGTAENKAILAASNLLLPAFDQAQDADLLIAVRISDKRLENTILHIIDTELEKTRNRDDGAGTFRPGSIEGALKILPGANLVLISVAGRYAGDVADQAIDHGLHVMLFSDNVSLEEEIALKRRAHKSGLLVMGPDCGTAIINGVPLAFANNVRRGSIGIVAASGTGLQEVSCIISNEGEGVSQAIGTGGRDVKKDIGGIMFMDALEALAEDEATRVILLVSKPPHEDVLKKIRDVADSIEKPVVSIFLGAPGEDPLSVATLEEAALVAVSLARGESTDGVTGRLKDREGEIKRLAKSEAEKRATGQRYIRGLFSGGTFCSEAQVLLGAMLDGIYANSPAGDVQKLPDTLKSVSHTLVDMGEDEFTVGRPHPMIDYSLRNQRIESESRDPETAVILLDVVLGYGSNMDPATELVPVLRDAAERVTVVSSVTGTDADPQNRAQVKAALEEAGVIVMPSNAAACWLAGHIAQILEDKA